MKTLKFGLVAAAIALTVAGCSAAPQGGSAPVALASARPSASASASPTPVPTPVVTSAPAAAATPTASPTLSGAVDGPGAVMPDPTEAPVATAPTPEPAPPVDPNAVDPALYPSHAVDTVNGGGPRPGVEFMIADGSVLCGIQAAGQLGPWASCSPASWKTMFWQPSDQPPYIQSVEIMNDAPYETAAHLYGDPWAKPARTVPVLPDGKSITEGGITCSVAGPAVTCLNSFKKGFVLTGSTFSPIG